MFDLPSFRIGRIFGIPVEVNASWVLIFGLVVASLSFSYYPQIHPDRPLVVDVASGVITALLFFGSVLLHETAHSVVARAGGAGISKITLFVFGGVAQMEEEPSSAGKEFVMAIAGPATSVAIGAVSFVSYLVLMYVGVSSTWWAPLEYLAAINVGVAVFNMLPGFPLDGGRVLRAFLWWASGDLLTATRWASFAGRIIGWLMVGGGLFGVASGSYDLAWFAVLGWFLANMAGSAFKDQKMRSRLATVSIGSQMTSPAAIVPGQVTVSELFDRHLLGGLHDRYPVVVGEEVVGVLDTSILDEVPRAEWGSTRVVDLMQRDLQDLTVAADAGIDSVLGKLGPEGSGALMVVFDGHLQGMIARSDVIRALRRVPGD